MSEGQRQTTADPGDPEQTDTDGQGRTVADQQAQTAKDEQGRPAEDEQAQTATARSGQNVEASNAGPSVSRRTALAVLGAGVTGGATFGPAASAGSSTETWQNDRDARGHDLRDAGTVDTAAVAMESLDTDVLEGVGSLTVGAADLGHSYSRAVEADRVVWKDEDGTFHADRPDGEVASGGELLSVVQAAVDSLTAGRTHKETVLVAASGSVPLESTQQPTVELPSYTVLDVPGRIHVEYPEGGNSGSPVVRATDAAHVEIPRLTVTGGPWMAIRTQSCTDVSLGRFEVRCAPDSSSNTAIRLDDSGDSGRSTDVRLDAAYVEHSGHHAVETYGIDRCQVGEILAREQGGVGVLMNDTTDATVGSVAAENPSIPPSYATFRCANHCEGVTVGQVVSQNAPRGVHLITNSDDVTIGEVDIIGARDHGIKVDRTVDNVVIQGGRVKNTAPTAVVIQGGSVTLRDLRVVDDRPEHDRGQEYGIHVTHTARHCQVVNNDVRRAGTEADIHVDPPADDARPSTTVRDNVGDGIASGSVVLQSGFDPAARVEGISQRRDVTLELRASVVRGPSSDEPFAWDGYFEWNSDTSQWDLVVEWKTDPLENVEFEYVIDQPLANLGRVSGEVDTV